MSSDIVADDDDWRRECVQMWEFMAGIEGFAITRAADCLSKLLCAHYDTMNVLKLVTKQDLIEDAGLKPGDALRIVYAVKEWASGKQKRACEFPESGKKKSEKITQDTWKREDASGPLQDASGPF